MNKESDLLISKRKFPSPHPDIDVFMVTYLSSGLRVKGFLAEPKKKNHYPGLLYLRGGISRVGMVRLGRIIQFAAKGFVVMAPFYRGNLGGEGHEDFGGDDRWDAINAYEILETHPKVDKKSIHVFGFSRGGVMALLVGRMLNDVASIVTWGGVSDMVLTYEERVDLRRMMKRVIGGTPRKVPERYKWRTPIHEIDNINAPVLIIHGAQDKNVSIDHALLLEKCLKESNKKVTTWVFQDFTHYFPPVVNRNLVSKLTDWMKKQSK